jgi:hypothetical protein
MRGGLRSDPRLQERILRNPFSRFDPRDRADNKVGQASRLPSGRVRATLPGGAADGDRRDACPTLWLLGRESFAALRGNRADNIRSDMIAQIRHGAGLARLHPAASGPRIAFDAGFIPEP